YMILRLPSSVDRSGHIAYLHSFPTRRSSDLGRIQGVGRGLRSVIATLDFKIESPRPTRHFLLSENVHIGAWWACPDRHVTSTHRDRKSTRLNSSHVKILYAVFCLKKKSTANE